jgi:hypothetical protein
MISNERLRKQSAFKNYDKIKFCGVNLFPPA